MILVSFGTRPEFIKIKPVIENLEIPYKLLFTGQHEDLLSNVEEEVTKLTIDSGQNRLDSIVCSILNKDDIFEGVDAVMVQGDTTSAFSVALAAYHRGIKIIHLEAGLRSFNNKHPFPEEFNRRSISCMADIHLCPTKHSAKNLRAESIDGIIYNVGNTALDNIKDLNKVYGQKILVTLHRRENFPIIEEWFTEINRLAEEHPELEFILPIHPNPSVKRHVGLLKSVKVVEPMAHREFLELLASCKFVITDSGGLQEESSFLRKKCIVCRETTERPEGVHKFAWLANPKNLEKVFNRVNRDFVPHSVCPYGNGRSGPKINKVLKKELGYE